MASFGTSGGTSRHDTAHIRFTTACQTSVNGNATASCSVDLPVQFTFSVPFDISVSLSAASSASCNFAGCDDQSGGSASLKFTSIEVYDGSGAPVEYFWRSASNYKYPFVGAGDIAILPEPASLVLYGSGMIAAFGWFASDGGIDSAAVAQTKLALSNEEKRAPIGVIADWAQS
jgi:hypothetical protein